MQTGSLVNLLTANSKNPVPTVGMGATILLWSDRNPATVVEVGKSGKSVTVQDDKCVRTDSNGMSESQTYEFTINPKGPKLVFTLRKNGHWVAAGSDMKSGTHLFLGSRNRYHDFSF